MEVSQFLAFSSCLFDLPPIFLNSPPNPLPILPTPLPVPTATFFPNPPAPLPKDAPAPPNIPVRQVSHRPRRPFGHIPSAFGDAFSDVLSSLSHILPGPVFFRTLVSGILWFRRGCVGRWGWVRLTPSINSEGTCGRKENDDMECEPHNTTPSGAKRETFCRQPDLIARRKTIIFTDASAFAKDRLRCVGKDGAKEDLA